jgi:hypothetical protein
MHPYELKDGMLPLKPYRVDWFAQLTEHVKKLYPKTQIMVRLGAKKMQ